jgi:hypothetical protein
MTPFRENDWLFNPSPLPTQDPVKSRDYELEELLTHQELLPMLGPELGIHFAIEVN